MRVDLFGIGIKSKSPAITAERRINCFVEMRREMDRTRYVLVGRRGLNLFISSLGNVPTRGMWAVNTITTPLLFVVQGNTLYSVNNGGGVTTIGMINTSTGNVSMVDDGTFLVLVDGTNGWVYNMTTLAFTKITDGNFTTTPTTVTWQDRYFIVTAGQGRQFQLSQISPSVDPTVWPSVQINFAGSGAGSLRAGLADHAVLNLFGDVYTEFWQDTGSPDFPYAQIPSAAAQFGLAAPWSLTQFDNSMAGLFQDKSGALNISRMSGFTLKKLSDVDLESIIQDYPVFADAQAIAFMVTGHPMYLITFPSANQSWMYDEQSKTWGQVTDTNGNVFWGNKYAYFQNQLVISDSRNGNLYFMQGSASTDNGSVIPMEVWSKHIWNDDKYVGIPWIQVDIESGVGLVTGQGSTPVIDLQVSDDGGNSFYSVGYSSMGALGQYTQRVTWSSLGSARDRVLKLRITDPVKRIITGASAEIVGGSF